MMYDAQEYAAAIDEFVSKMAKIRKYSSSKLQEASTELCAMLGIGRMEVCHYGNSWQETVKKGTRFVVYDSGDADDSRKLQIQEDFGRGETVVCEIAPVTGREEWTEEERKRITTFQKLLLTFADAVHANRLADEQKYNDADLEVRKMAYFLKKVEKLIAKKEIENYGVCFFNIRRMSMLNRQLGRTKATGILRLFLAGLQKGLQGNECVCRVSGDNFLVLFCREKFDDIKTYLCGTEISDAKSGRTYMVNACQGYYMINPQECQAAMDIVDFASFAETVAKKSPDLPYVILNDRIRQKEQHEREVADLFRGAIENEEFSVYYQPKVSLDTYVLSGAEALCRWRHEGKMIQPMDFIPILEKSAKICKLDFYMLEHVCRDMRRWLDEGKKVVRTSVNLSRVHLGNTGLVNDIMRIIDKYEIPHEYIEIELTETTAEVDYNELRRLVTALGEQGIGTSVDDFGTGYSSLSLLREFPWSIIKIDKSFLPDADAKSTQKKIMMQHITAMARDLGLPCIAEGVETSEQVMMLKESNCFLAQGYYFDKPLPVEEFEKRLEGKK